jgi:CheY-like chemotaxis protein
MRQAMKKIVGARILRTVTDGEEALNYLTGSGRYADRSGFPFPNVLLLDLKMPRMNGFEVLEWVRKKSPMPQLPVVVFSASLEEKDRQKAYSLGANSFLVKPSDPKKLISMVQTMEMYWLKVNQPISVGVEENAVTGNHG